MQARDDEFGRRGVKNDDPISSFFSRLLGLAGGPPKDLLQAAAAGDAVLVLELIHQGYRVDARDPEGLEPDLTPLMISVRGKHVDVTQVLLKAGADANARDSAGGTPLFYAAANGHEHSMQLLLKHGANIKLTNNIKRSALFSAACVGDGTCCKLLLELKADVNARDEDGIVPIQVAALSYSAGSVDVLLQHGASTQDAAAALQTLEAQWLDRMRPLGEGNALLYLPVQPSFSEQRTLELLRKATQPVDPEEHEVL